MKCLLLVLLLIMPSTLAEVYITEVMYNPPGDDNNKEYIEVFSEEPVNLAEYIIEDFSGRDNLTLMQQANTSFYLIVEEGFNSTNINATVYTAGATIGNNLNNDGDLVVLRRSNSIADAVIYANELGANNDGNALCRTGSVFQNRLNPCAPTPGHQNVPINEPTNTTPSNASQPPLYDYSTIKINEVFPDPVGNDNAVMPQGEWVELYNSAETNVDAAGLKLKDKGDNAVTVSNTNVVAGTIMQPKGYLVVYMNGNSMLNNNGFEQVRLFKDAMLINEMSYVDSQRGRSWSKIDDAFKLTNATPGEENIFSEPQVEEDAGRKQKVQENTKAKDSYMEIMDITPRSVRFGDVLRIKLQIYRGETKKNSIQINLNSLGKPLSINLYNRFTNYTLQLPLMLHENCNNKFAPGNYTLIVKGLGIERRRDVTLDNGVCSAKVYGPLEGGYNASKQESFINYKEARTEELVYESTNVHIEKYAVYLFWMTAVLALGYVLYDRKIKGKISH